MPRICSEYAYFQTIIISPIVPTDLRLDQIGNAIRLSWLDRSSYEDGYMIERKELGGSWQKLYFVNEKIDYFTDYGPFTNGQTYNYRVSAFIILPNQDYLFSTPSDEDSITVVLSSASVDEENIVEVEFGETYSIVLDIKEKIRIYVKDPSETMDYLWFSDDDFISVSGAGDYVDVFAIEAGAGTVRVKKRDDSGEAIINISVICETINVNPEQVKNLRARALNNSCIELLWNYDSENNPEVSFFEIYRIERTGSTSIQNLVDFSDLNKNKVGVVPFDSTEAIYNFYDYGLRSDRAYLYLIAAISRYNRNSLYVQDEQYDYISSKNYSAARTISSDIEISPSLLYVKAGEFLYLGILNEKKKTFSDIEWSIEENNSGSTLRSNTSEVAYFEASDKSVSEDIVKIQAGGDVSRAKVIVTEII